MFLEYGTLYNGFSFLQSLTSLQDAEEILHRDGLIIRHHAKGLLQWLIFLRYLRVYFKERDDLAHIKNGEQLDSTIV